MLIPIIQFSISALVIFIAATFLVKFADQIAEITKLGRLLVGSLFLAAATSLPELLVDITAVHNGLPDIGVGNVFGSCLFNLLILAIGDIFHRGGTKVFSHESAVHALSAAMSIMIIGVAGIGIFLAPHAKAYSIGPLGLGTIAIVVFYIYGIRLIYFDQKISMARTNITTVEKPESIRIHRALAGYLISALIILAAAPFLAQAAGELADQTGLGRTFVGTTLVSLATTLPELVSTFTAIRMNAFALAIGNIFGSNAFNMLILLPLDIVHQKPILASVSPFHAFTALAVILVTSVTVMGQLYQVERRKKFIEPDAFAVITLILLVLFILYIFRDVTNI